MRRVGSISCIIALSIIAAAVFVAGIGWGLPSRAVDPYLFGDGALDVWSGKTIAALAPAREADAARGADVARGGAVDRSAPVIINATDAQRAAIVRRYRLFTAQPDEMITLMSLATMKRSGRLDPQMYQYGGLWIYPVGVMLKIASVAGVIHATPDLAYYYDHPGAFGRFYIVARLYSALWGVVGIFAVFIITQRLSRRTLVAAAASACCLCMPVVINMAHEAKPHLPGAVLSLLAIAAAMRYVRSGFQRWALATGCLCGAAFGIVLSTWPIFLVIPLMLVLRSSRWRKKFNTCLMVCAIAAAVYFSTNPYVAINLVHNRQVLESNLSNNAMFHIVQGARLSNAWRLIREGTSNALAIAGVLGLIAQVILGVSLWRRRGAVAAKFLRRPICREAILLAVPALVGGAQFIVLAGGRPGEYGRFALLVDIALAICAACTVSTLTLRGGLILRRRRRGAQGEQSAADHRGLSTSARRPLRLIEGVVYLLLLALTASAGYRYERCFLRDSPSGAPTTTRMMAAARLHAAAMAGAHTLAITAEPAPYDMPPVNLFKWQIVLLPREAPNRVMELHTDAVVAVAETAQAPIGADPAYNWYWEAIAADVHLDQTPISWAGKRFVVGVRKEFDAH